MNVQGAMDQAGRLIEDLHRQARNHLAGGSYTEEPTAGELWEKASPQLDRALAIYNQKESADTPESTWVPWRKTKKNCERDLEEILNTLLAVLGTCGAAGYRARIRNLQADNVTSNTRIAKYREQALSASSEQAQNFVEGLITSSKEAIKDSIADETDRIAERNQQIENLKAGFRVHLQHIGISVPPETADSFLLSVEDDIVSMAAVISNIGRLTEQLQNLVDESKEAPEQTRRYYGMYVLLVFAVDRIQTHFIDEIDLRFLPRISGYEKEAAQHMSDAQAQIKAGGSREPLEANVAAHRHAIQACRLLSEMLRNQRRTVLEENRKVQSQEAVAVNTYRTVCLSINIAEMIGSCQAAFRALRDLRLPPLRPFQNVQLNEEMQKLAERVAGKE